MKKPEFSEFTFGYAFTHNFQAWLGSEFQGVPIFPSLLEEGRRGGGYDVEISTKSEPFLFQFKIPQIITRRSKLIPPRFSPPYYRMHLEPGARSTQHESLVTHSQKGRRVYYVTSRFERLNHLKAYFEGRCIPEFCAFIDPADIGQLDDQGHFIAYQKNGSDAWLHSEPQVIKSPRSADDLRNEIRSALADRAVAPESESAFLNRLATELLQSIAETTDRLRGERRKVRERERSPEYIYEALAPRSPDDTLKLSETAQRIEDPLERLAHIATFVLDSQLIFVGPAV